MPEKTAYLANIRKMSLQRPKFSIAERHNLFYEKEKKILKVLYDIMKKRAIHKVGPRNSLFICVI